MARAPMLALVALALAACERQEQAPLGKPTPGAAQAAGLSPPAAGGPDARGALPERVYVTNERSSTLSVIDPAIDRAVQSIAVEGRPRGIHVSPDGRRVYVAISRAFEDQQVREGVLELDATSGKVVAVHEVGSDLGDFALGARPARLYVANEGEGTASVVELPSGRILTRVPVGSEPEGVGISPDGRWVYVTAETSNTVSVLDTSQGQVVASFQVDSRPQRASFTPDGKLALVTAEAGGSVSVVDVARRAVVGRYSFSSPVEHPVGVLTSSDGRWGYVAASQAGTVVVLDLKDPEHPELAATIPVGEKVWGLGLTSNGRKLYAANSGSNDVSVIDTAARRVVATVTVGDGPWGVGIGPAPQALTRGAGARSR